MRKKKRHQKIREYVKDLKSMSEDAYKLCDPDTKNCNDCKDLLKCMNGIRNGVGDLAETLSWTMEQIGILDDSIYKTVKGTSDFLEETGIHVDGLKKKFKKKKKNKKKKDELTHEAEGFYT